MNAFLSYYPENERNSWNLASLLKSCEKIHGLYFHVLNQIVSIDNPLPLFTHMQTIYLCTMMMWISNTESELKFKLIRHAFSALNECKLLPNLIRTMFENALSGKTDFIESEDEAILMLPSPLNMIDILSNDDNPNHLSNKLKEKFLLLRNVPLHLSFTMEFIYFLDKILDFAKDQATPLERTILLENAKPYHYILNSLNEIYCDNEKWPLLVGNNRSFIIIICSKLVELMNKWALAIQKKQNDNTVSIRTSKKLIKENEIQQIQEKQALAAKLAELQKQKNKKTAEEFSEKQLKKAEEEHDLRVKKEERSTQNRLSELDQTQQTISASLGNIEQPKEKEERIIEEIYKYLGCENLGLELLKQTILSIDPQLEDSHAILILLSSLFDNFTSQLQNNLRIYQKKYSAPIVNTTDKFGTRLFSQTDRDNNKLINDSLPEIITCISKTEIYAEKALTTLQIIKNIRSQIQDNNHYQAWDKAEKFRILEYTDIYKKVSFNFEQFKENRINKEKVFLAGGIPSCKKTDTPKPIKESEISEKLAVLKQSFGKLNEKIKECLLIIQPMHSHMHEVLDLSHNFSDLTLSANTEIKTKIFQFFKQEFNPKTTVERKQILLTALNQLLDEKYDPLKMDILSEINNDQALDDNKFSKLFETIKAQTNIIPALGRSMSF